MDMAGSQMPPIVAVLMRRIWNAFKAGRRSHSGVVPHRMAVNGLSDDVHACMCVYEHKACRRMFLKEGWGCEAVQTASHTPEALQSSPTRPAQRVTAAAAAGEDCASASAHFASATRARLFSTQARVPSYPTPPCAATVRVPLTLLAWSSTLRCERIRCISASLASSSACSTATVVFWRSRNRRCAIRFFSRLRSVSPPRSAPACEGWA